eukprot:SAG22_NODE_1357_length_4629_cov_10.880922_5_plen_68_part_00
MVVHAEDAVDEREMERARQRADRVVRKRAQANLKMEEMLDAAEKESRARGEAGTTDLNAPLWKIWHM